MKILLPAVSLCLILGAAPLRAEETPPVQKLTSVLTSALGFLHPAAGAPVQSLQLSGSMETATGALKDLKGATFDLQMQPPHYLKLQVAAAGHAVTLCQNGPQWWIQVPEKKLLVIGDPAVPRFSTRPDSVQPTTLDLYRLPISRTQIMMIPALITAASTPAADGHKAFTLSPSPAAAAMELPVRNPSLTAIIPTGSASPQSIVYKDDANSFTLRLASPKMDDALPPSTWEPVPDASYQVEKVALAHLERFFKSAVGSLGSRLPTLPPATGQRWLLGTSGAGRLEDHDGTRVLFLAGTPEEMGRQHGTLLKKEIRRVVERILYGVGVGSSFDKGRWFFGEIEEAVRRTGPFINPRHLAEMDALAAAAGLDSEEVRLANFFPELFHCSGFALLGKATAGGHLYHGRVLDYLRGAGLEENAVVIVSQPDRGHAWVNISYAGFTGSVTAMNEKQLCLGEMGGKGEGSWDGKPMAQLVREVMEQCSTIEEGLDFMRRTPRTCEYYYVLSDAKSHRACGIKATPEIFEVIWTGESHPQLNDAVADTVLLSAGSRYEELVRRVKDGFGNFDAPKAIQLMTRPVCMTSNIHSVLFAPDTLDFWVANADSVSPASETRFTAYNLKSLLQAAPAAARP